MAQLGSAHSSTPPPVNLPLTANLQFFPFSIDPTSPTVMKLLYALSFFLISLAVPAQAQKVYNTVMDNALHVLNSPSSPFTQVQIALFKRDALLYLRKKAVEANGTPTGKFLDTQAYFLS